MRRKTKLLLASLTSCAVLVGGTFAAYLVTDNADPFDVIVTPGENTSETEHNSVTLSWGQCDVAKVEGLKVGETRRVGSVTLESTDATYEGIFKVGLNQVDYTSGIKNFADFLIVDIFDSATANTPVATVKNYQEVKINSVAKTYYIDVTLDVSASPYYEQAVLGHTASITYDWGAKEASKPFDKIYFNNSEKWASVYAYAWTGSSINASYPGHKMSVYNGDIYEYDLVKEYNYDFIIFNDGTNVGETLEIPADLSATPYYNGSAWVAAPSAPVDPDDPGDTPVEPHEHVYVNGKCECGAEDPNYEPPHEHVYVDGKCECGAEDPNYVAPEEPATKMTIAEALAAADDTKVEVRGIVKTVSAWNTQYSNNDITIVDEKLDQLFVFRCSTDVEVGDDITVTGTMTTYNGARQVAQGSTAVIHSSGNEIPAPEFDSEFTKTVVIADYADANGWVNGTKYETITIDENVSVKAVGTQNTAKYYENGENWRIYQGESPTITFTVAEGYVIDSISVEYTISNSGVLTFEGANIASAESVDIDATTAVFGVGNTGTATNGQVRITSMTVGYSTSTQQPVEPEEPVHTHTFENNGPTCDDPTCDEPNPNYVEPHEHVYVDGKCECGAEDPNYVAPETPTTVTIAEALAAADDTKVEVRGIVKTVSAWNTQYNNNDITIVDEELDELFVFRCSTEVKVGDDITVTGTMTTYNGARQVAQGSTAVIHSSDNKVPGVVEVEFEVPENGELVKAEYTGTTTTNMNGENNAASINLDAEDWTVIASKGEASNFPGLNKAGEIRLYGKAGGTGNYIDFTYNGGTIDAIRINFKQGADLAEISVNETAVTGTSNVYEINASSFHLENICDGTTQIHIYSIEFIVIPETAQEPVHTHTFENNGPTCDDPTCDEPNPNYEPPHEHVYVEGKCECGAEDPNYVAPETAKLYLNPNENWKQSNARFAAYFFGNGEKWVDMTDADGDKIYEVELPEGFENVIFCRMNPGAAANNWTNKWNQTADLKVPTDGTNMYTVAEGTWDQGGGVWSVFGEEIPDVEVDNSIKSVGLIGSMNGWGTDIDLETTDNVTYTITYTFEANSEWKLRANDAWNVSWGGSSVDCDIPGAFNVSGDNIITNIAGTYTITFNVNTQRIVITQ